MYAKVLIANRGEIALRIIRTLREMGVTSVAVYSDADRSAPHVLEADESHRIGPPPAPESYLDQEVLIRTASVAGCDAIHPGYGFLAENAAFAEAVAAANLTFIGPTPRSIQLMGDKIEARKTAAKVGVAVVPGSTGAVASLGEAEKFVAEHGLPVMVKAGGGGGGRGIRIVERADQLAEALERASKEAGTYFHNTEVYLERFFPRARHIEVQIVGDKSGKVVAWGERDCSTQRRRQKLLEETPAPGISSSDRSGLMESALKLARAAKYVGVGTVEFLYAGPGHYYFLEMNTRIQVEHTITEEVTGQDLIRESIEVCCGKPVLADVVSNGHAIEARINAEDPARDFAPGPGMVTVYREPGGPGVRMDTGVYQGWRIPGNYDSLIAKLIVHAPDRQRAIGRLLGALHGCRIEGVPTTLGLIRNIVDSRAFRDGGVTTDWLDANLDGLVGEPQVVPRLSGAESGRTLDLEVNGKRFEVRVLEASEPELERRTRQRGARASHLHGSQTRIVSPMHGTVIAVKKQVGEPVSAGEGVFVLEAMKMENEITAPRKARIASILAGIGDTVDVGQTLAELEG